jgi:predicted glycogen debranching enzyme
MRGGIRQFCRTPQDRSADIYNPRFIGSMRARHRRFATNSIIPAYRGDDKPAFPAYPEPDDEGYRPRGTLCERMPMLKTEDEATPQGIRPDPLSEWLEADGRGGFASGTAGGVRTRRYHALLLTATTPPSGRVVLVNGIDAWVESGAERFALSSHRYAPDMLYPDGQRRLVAFAHDPWPRWMFRLESGHLISQELLVDRDGCETMLRWRLLEGDGPIGLALRPLLSGRDFHGLHRENPRFDFRATIEGGNVAWRPYPEFPAIAALTNGAYTHAPDWYRNFTYDEEAARGLDHIEDLATPGLFRWDLGTAPAILMFRTGDGLDVRSGAHAERLAESETARRNTLEPRFGRAVESYLVDRDRGGTILAGFPWFADWGRDTFVALRGLCLATGRLDEAEAILAGWANAVSEGMLPNRFPDEGDVPEYNSVDAALWFVVATHDFFAGTSRAGRPVRPAVADALRAAVDAILAGYAAGTRHGIGLDTDGLLRAGSPGQQLTWMDAKVGDRVVTPRIGKPVEIQALWLNALRIAGAWSDRWHEIAARGLAAFLARFPDPETGGLYDVIDVDHVAGTVDGSIRPNQIFAAGGLPFPLITGDLARSVTALVETRLATPLGLRTLDPADPRYVGQYVGGVPERDGAYHQGTAWPWLMGAFVEAWIRVHGDSARIRRQARDRFLAPLLAHLEVAGLGHVSEICDGDAPHTPRGCPFQAWSLGELIRLMAATGEPGPTGGK